MQDLSSPPSFTSFRGLRLSLFFIFIFVIICHLLLLGVSIFYKTPHLPPKQRGKIVVQTVTLNPVPSLSPKAPSPQPIPIAPAILPIEEFKAKDPLPQEKIEPQSEDKIVQKEPTLFIKEKEELVKKEDPFKPKTEPVVNKKIEDGSPPSHVKPHIQKLLPPPTPKIEKPKAVVVKKIPEKKPLEKKIPEKKRQELPKNVVNTENLKAKIDNEADKKRQVEEAEKKRRALMNAEAEKIRQDERALAEKKRQAEKAEEEMRRKKEIAAAQEAAKQKVQAHLSKAKETLAKNRETRDKITSTSSVSLETTPIPKELGLLQVDALPAVTSGKGETWGIQEVSYSEEVAYRLKMSLRLPDYGSLKIKLTLDRNGKVVKIETLHTQSAKNKTYVESKIAAIVFPPFGQRFVNEAQNTFVITLQNDS